MSARLAGALMGGAVLGKVLGFAREIEMARLLGAALVADGFRGAQTAVLLPVAPLQSDMLPSVLIPLHRSWREQGRAAECSTALAALLTGFAALVAVAVYYFAARWAGLLLGGFDAAGQALTVGFIGVMTLAIPFSVLSAVLSAISIALGRSRIAAIRASIQNVALMAGIAIMAATGRTVAIPCAFVVAFVLVALYGTAVLWREGALAARGLSPRLLAEVGAVFCRRFRPLLAVPLADQGNILLERLLASGVALGAIASLDYARTLTESAFYLISQPIGYVLLTRAPGDDHALRGDVEAISRRLLALGVPASVFIAVFATDIVQLVFARGAFDAHATALTAGALRGIGLGLWAAMLGWVLVRLVNAAGRNVTAAGIIVAAYATNALVNLAGVPFLGTLGLGLGETARGVVLLGGVAVALGCGGVLLRCLARAVAPAAALAGAGAIICLGVEASLPRLTLAAPVFGLATIAWLATTMPEEARRVARLVRNPRRLAAAGWRQG